MDPSDSTDGQGHADGYSRSKLREGCDKFTQGQVRPYRYGRTCAAIPVAYNPNTASAMIGQSGKTQSYVLSCSTRSSEADSNGLPNKSNYPRGASYN